MYEGSQFSNYSLIASYVWTTTTQRHFIWGMLILGCISAMVVLLYCLSFISTWFLWLSVSALQFVYVLYQFVMIIIGLIVVTQLKMYSSIRRSFRRKFHIFQSKERNSAELWKARLEDAKTLEDFLNIDVKEAIQEIEERDTTKKHQHKKEDHNEKVYGSYQQMEGVTAHLREIRSKVSDRIHVDDNSSSLLSELKFLLHNVVKRNHMSINNSLIQDAQHVTEMGRHLLSKRMRESIYQFQEEVEKCLDYIAQADCISDQSFLTNSGFEDKDKEFRELSNRRKLMMKLKHNMGRTALMLSGGGAQSMHHLGTIKALCESKLYDDIEVISGASG